MAAIGLRSNMPNVGRTRRIGEIMGSVIWMISVLMLTSIGCGLLPVIGTINDRIDRATMAKMRTVKMVSIIPAKGTLRYCCPSCIDFR